MAQLKGLDGDLLTGREIYAQPSITGLNRVPVTILSSYVLAKASITSGDPPFTLEELAAELLVDGPHIKSAKPLAREGEEICGVWESGRDEFVLRIGVMQGNFMPTKYIFREFERTADGFSITDYEHEGDDYKVVSSGGRASADQLMYVYNPVCPTGILMPAQVTYNRLEENAKTVRRFTTGANAKTLIFGNIRNKNTATQDLSDDDKDYAYIGGSDNRADRMGSTAQIDSLMKEAEYLRALYDQQVHVVDMTSPVQRPSGSDRAMVLGPMLRFIDAITTQITRVLAAYDSKWKFERIHTTDVLDRTQQLDLLERQLALGVITQAQFNQRAGEL